MNLYEVSKEFEELLQQAEMLAEDAGGEIPEGLAIMLDNAEMNLHEKLDNIIRYCKSLRADADALKKEAEMLRFRRDQKERKIAALESWVETCGIEKWESPAGVISSRKSQAVEVDLDAHIPHQFLVVKTTETADKVGLKAYIKAGNIVDGVRIIERRSVSIK